MDQQMSRQQEKTAPPPLIQGHVPTSGSTLKTFNEFRMFQSHMFFFSGSIKAFYWSTRSEGGPQGFVMFGSPSPRHFTFSVRYNCKNLIQKIIRHLNPARKLNR